jgi:hypothetical protein
MPLEYQRYKDKSVWFDVLVAVHTAVGNYYYQIVERKTLEELDGTVSALERAVAEVKQRWSVIRWVTKNLLSRAPPCFGRHVKPLVPAAFAVVSTHQPALGPRGGL